MDAVLYVHGKGGSAEESKHYMTLFPACDVIGLDYLRKLTIKRIHAMSHSPAKSAEGS